MGEKIEKCMLYMYYFCANCEIVEKLVCSTYVILKIQEKNKKKLQFCSAQGLGTYTHFANFDFFLIFFLIAVLDKT